MITRVKIVLGVPNSDKPGRYFSLRLKQEMYNEQDEYNKPSKIFVVSDIEGGFKAFYKILYKGGVINEYLKWNFDDGHLVIVGDCFDRGEQVIECLWLIYSLEEMAKTKGGHVHFILGNHEIMNLNGDWRYVHPKYAMSSKIPYTALYYGNSELWHWICTKNIMERIGDVLFVHGGISPELLYLDVSINTINAQARGYYTKAKEQFVNPLLNIIYNSAQSPFWYRGYYQQTVSEEHINDTLKHFGVKTIVTGHTIVDKITSFFNGKVINVNTDHASGNSEALLIRKNSFYRINKDGKRERIK